MDHTAAVDIEAVAVFQEEASQAEDIQEAATEADSQIGVVAALILLVAAVFAILFLRHRKQAARA